MLGLCLGAVVAWLALQWYEDDVQSQRNRELQNQLLLAQDKLGDLEARFDTLQGQFAIEASTRQGLETTLRTLQAELGAAHDQLAFFDELLPPGPDGAITIRGLDVQHQGGGLKYRMLLARRGANTKPFKGKLQFEAEGQRDGKAATVILAPAPDVDFERFQSSTGVLLIPDGFDPQQLTVRVLEGDSVRASRTHSLGDGEPDG